MIDEIVDLSKKLISIKSNPGNNKELEDCLSLCLDELRGFTIERLERNGVKSALIYNTEKRSSKFKVILNGHLDIIPGKDFQHKPYIKGNKLYGAGAMDMKSNVACLISIFKEVSKKVNYPLGLQLVTDEEIGGFDGTKFHVDDGLRTEFVIAGESTNFNIVHKAKGIVWLQITSKGETAHGAYPWKGKNAIWEMESFLSKLRHLFPIPKQQEWITTCNLSSIKTTNDSFNKVPDNCTISLDIRYIPEDKKNLLKSIEDILPENFDLEIITDEEALFVKEDNHFIQLLKKVDEEITGNKVVLYGAQGSSDARHFTKVGCDGIEFGPIGGGIGSDEEWVDIPSLETYVKILSKFLLEIK